MLDAESFRYQEVIKVPLTSEEKLRKAAERLGDAQSVQKENNWAAWDAMHEKMGEKKLRAHLKSAHGHKIADQYGMDQMMQVHHGDHAFEQYNIDNYDAKPIGHTHAAPKAKMQSNAEARRGPGSGGRGGMRY
jgi:hypothetical protein